MKQMPTLCMRGSWLNFGQGCVTHSSEWSHRETNFCENDSLAINEILHQKCHEVALSRRKLPTLSLSTSKSPKVLVSLQDLPKFDFSLTEIAEKYTLARRTSKKYILGKTRSPKKCTLAGRTTPLTLCCTYISYI